MRTLTTACALLFASTVAAAPPTPEADVRQQLDRALEAKWKSLQLTPEAPADDATFLRRVWLDLTGRVPPPLKAREFLDDKAPDKRTRLVEGLLASEEFADWWGRVWTQRLTDRRPLRQDGYDGRVLHEYLRESLLANKSYQRLVTELICGEGLMDASGPANFLLRYEAKPADLAGAVGRHFLGISLQCAQCHDHPHAPWKQEDFWGVAAFFGRLRQLQSNDDNGATLSAVLESRRGELLRPDLSAPPDMEGNRPMKKIAPRLPLSKTSLPAEAKRRQALAAWVTGNSNPYFAKHAVNRVWAQLFGKALAEPLDQPLGDVNGKHPQALNLLAADFTASEYDIKRLVRILLLSRAYQLGGGSDKGEASAQADDLRVLRLRNFARFPTRALSVDQLYQSIAQATGHRGDEPTDTKEMTEEEEGTTDVPVNLLGDRAHSVQRSLAMLNSEYVHKAVQNGARTAQTVNGRRLGAPHVEWLFLSTLARRPTADESAALRELLKNEKDVRGLEDILWVLLNSAEFATNH
jgi:hypothetical protein